MEDHNDYSQYEELDSFRANEQTPERIPVRNAGQTWRSHCARRQGTPGETRERGSVPLRLRVEISRPAASPVVASTELCATTTFREL